MRLFERPSNRQTLNFINFVANDHSWYKHLNEERSDIFIFYLDPYVGDPLFVSETAQGNRYTRKRDILNRHQSSYGFWNYYTDQYSFNYIPNSDGSFSDSRAFIGLHLVDEVGLMSQIPDEVISIGDFRMSRYLHKRAFENATKYLASDGMTYAEKHRILIKELEEHLNTILDRIYEY